MNKMTCFLILLLGVLPLSASAEAYFGRVDTSSLDDDVVEAFPIPVLFGVEYDSLVPDFGDPRSGGRSHEGQDMRAPEGAPIVTPTDAVVLKTGNGTYSGKYVYTKNPGGETFVYMHLRTIANIDVGDALEPGDFIGTVGDTGNAPDGIYHLHFEVHDEDGNPVNPYERLSEDGFTLKEKMSFLRDVFRKMAKDEAYAEFLVETFNDDFVTAAQKKYDMPAVIEEALDDVGIDVDSAAEKLQKLSELIGLLPTALPMELKNGDVGPAVTLLQLYLIYISEGSARNALKAAGPTGYFGSVTEAALAEYQEEVNVLTTEKGAYDAKTRTEMMKEKYPNLNLQ